MRRKSLNSVESKAVKKREEKQMTKSNGKYHTPRFAFDDPTQSLPNFRFSHPQPYGGPGGAIPRAHFPGVSSGGISNFRGQ